MTRDLDRPIGTDGWHPGAPPRVPAWVGDIIAGAVVIASAFVPLPETEFHPSEPLGFALVLAPALILPLRRRLPVAVLAACVAVYAIAAFTDSLWPGAVLAIAIAMFGYAARSSRRATTVVTFATVGVVVVINVLASLGSPADLRGFAIVITIAFAAAAGDALRSGHEYIVAATERAERAEASREAEARRQVSEERLRIARDLHDAVAHQIAVISLNAGVASSAIGSRPDDAQEAVRTIGTAARTVLGEIGALLEVLRQDDVGGARGVSPQAGLDRLGDLVAQFEDAGLAVTVRTEGDVAGVGGSAGAVAYRVVQEGLTNAHKHGAEARAHVLIRVGDDSLEVVVANPSPARQSDGTGPAGPGLGLIGLRERVAAVGGTVDTGATPGGWRVAASLPLGTEPRP